MCSALYCEPVSRDFGVRSFGQRGFGGLLENIDVKGKTAFIPQYNLESFWKRSIVPIRIGIVEPLLDARFQKTKFSRLPGQFQSEIPYYEIDNRNLLASKIIKNDCVRIWTVNERSKKHLLERFDFKIQENGILERIPYEKEAAWKYDQSAIELRSSKWTDEVNNLIYLKKIKSLEIKFDNVDDFQCVHNAPVKEFDENSLISGEICILDYGGMLWLKNVERLEESARRIKCENKDEVFENVSWSDHPRIVVLATQEHARTVDIRMNQNRTCCEIFRVKQFDYRRDKDPMYISEHPIPNPVIRHVKRINHTNSFLIGTDHALHMVDDRFPGNSVLTIKHSIPDGGHKMIVSNEVKDPVDGGEVTSVFLLDQSLLGVSMCRIYQHSSQIWSAVSHLHSIGDSGDFQSTVFRGKYLDANSFVNEPVRAISLVEGIEDKNGKNYTLLLRQNDDGAIWWQRFANYQIGKEEKAEEEENSWKRVHGWAEKQKEKITKPTYVENFPKQLTQDPKENRIAISVGVKIGRKMMKVAENNFVDERRFMGQLYTDDSNVRERLSIVPIQNEAAQELSRIILEKKKNGYENSERDAAEKLYDTDF